MGGTQASLLTTRRFLPLFLTQFLGAFNDNVFKNALIILMTFRAGAGAPLLVTAAAGIFILPFFLFSATAGQLADKFDKARLIRLIKAAEIILMILAGIGFYMESYPFLLAVLFGTGAHSAFFGPLKYSILPDHLKEGELVGANALVEAGTFIAILTGTLVGGILIEAHTTAVSAVLFSAALAGWAISRHVPAAPGPTPHLALRWNIFSETWRILRRARQQKTVFAAIIGISWFWLLGFTFLTQFPTYSKDIVGGDASVVTLFLTIFSVGIAFGSLLCGSTVKGRPSARPVVLGAALMTAAIALLWAVSPAAPAAPLVSAAAFVHNAANIPLLLSLFMIAVGGGIYIVPLYTLLQTESDKAGRSRTIAANNIMNALFMVASSLGAMALLKHGCVVTDIFLMLGIVNIPVALLMRRTIA